MTNEGIRVSRLGFILGALFLSGIAGLANQVIWQRGLKVFLGGSETLSAMIAVLVFMLGLGLGALSAGALCEGAAARSVSWRSSSSGCSSPTSPWPTC